MKLFKDILAQVLSKQDLQITINDWNMQELIQTLNFTMLGALEQILRSLQDDELSDFECIEEIVEIFEDLGSDCGNRHDFG